MNTFSSNLAKHNSETLNLLVRITVLWARTRAHPRVKHTPSNQGHI